MARTAKRKAQSVKVPTIEQDAAERKRLLNVLAQRRYRERKRQRFEEMESKIKTRSTEQSESCTPSDSESPLSTTSLTRDDKSASFNPNLDFNLYPLEDSHEWDTSVLFPTLSTSKDGSRTSASTPASNVGVRESSSSLSSVDSLTFPDEAFLPMLELNLLKAGLTIAKRLDVETIIWDLTAMSPFNSSSDLNYDHLPVNFQPTFTQLTVPHHPFLDILPWPEVRDKLIFIFSQPESLRPPAARSPTAMIGFVYDIEDTAEGIRVTGDDPYASDNWELGQKVFTKWWWAFTNEIIDHSNAVREARGATMLSGAVLVEVV